MFPRFDQLFDITKMRLSYFTNKYDKFLLMSELIKLQIKLKWPQSIIQKRFTTFYRSFASIHLTWQALQNKCFITALFPIAFTNRGHRQNCLKNNRSHVLLSPQQKQNPIETRRKIMIALESYLQLKNSWFLKDVNHLLITVRNTEHSKLRPCPCFLTKKSQSHINPKTKLLAKQSK